MYLRYKRKISDDCGINMCKNVRIEKRGESENSYFNCTLKTNLAD